MNAITSINRIIGTKEFRQLAALSKTAHQFNLIEMLETTVTENAWSRILAFLFDSRREHALGNRVFLLWVQQFESPAWLKRLVIEHPSIQVNAKTEWYTPDGRRLDILIQLFDDSEKCQGILGIENKVWADEGDDQIGCYQNALVKVFPKFQKSIVFLTPDAHLPHTADILQIQCPPVATGYETLINSFKELVGGEKISPDLDHLLESLQNYVKKEITMPKEESQEITRLIRQLYAQPSNRMGMQMIAEYLPSVRSLTKSIEEAINHSITNKFPTAEARWMYQPGRGSNPYELKWIPEELGHRTWRSGMQIAINFMLRCDRFNPGINDEYQFIVAAWCRPGADHEKARKLILSGWSGTLDKNLPSCWEPLWVGTEYRLCDLGDNDAAGLTKLLLKGILETYPKIRKKVFANFPGKK